MTKSKVYTRGGDKGQTSLVSGKRVSKGSHRIHLYGEVDELNSYLGIITSEMSKFEKFNSDNDFILDIQSTLFSLGSNLACEEELREKYKLPQIEESIIGQLEVQIDELDAQLKPLKNFILPGGHIVSSHLHLARTICRRIERSLIAYGERENESLPKNSIMFINRLSDYLFVLARYANFLMKTSEIEWRP